MSGLTNFFGMGFPSGAAQGASKIANDYYGKGAKKKRKPGRSGASGFDPNQFQRDANDADMAVIKETNRPRPGQSSAPGERKSRVDRTVGGAIVDPYEPTGVDWVKKYGPQRPEAREAQQRVNFFDQGMTPDVVDPFIFNEPNGGRSMVSQYGTGSFMPPQPPQQPALEGPRFENILNAPQPQSNVFDTDPVYTGVPAPQPQPQGQNLFAPAQEAAAGYPPGFFPPSLGDLRLNDPGPKRPKTMIPWEVFNIR